MTTAQSTGKRADHYYPDHGRDRRAAWGDGRNEKAKALLAHGTDNPREIQTITWAKNKMHVIKKNILWDPTPAPPRGYFAGLGPGTSVHGGN